VILAILWKMGEKSGAPELTGSHPITVEQREAYRSDGFAIVRGLAGRQEIAAHRQPIAAAVDRLTTERRPLSERDTYHKAFLQVPNLWRRDPEVVPFVLSPRFGQVAADLMGVGGARIYHDQALFKEPGGGFTPWHQDQVYWPLASNNMITMWMPLVDIPQGMQFVVGSHLNGDMGAASLLISDESEQHFDGVVSESRLEIREAGPMQAGDATFHAGWTVHRAPGNSTDRMREVMTVIYFEDGARVGGLDSKSRERDGEAWFPGLADGDIAATELNPLVTPRR
jgi:ectoine hydroxylase-related dioxygenase (phytanoyl-CoA dioxygenase family)